MTPAPIPRLAPRGTALTAGLRTGALAGALLLALSPQFAPAQSASASFQVPRQTLDGGAARTASASYAVDASIGQPDAGAPMASASFALRGGFHRAAATGPLPDGVFTDGFESP